MSMTAASPRDDNEPAELLADQIGGVVIGMVGHGSDLPQLSAEPDPALTGHWALTNYLHQLGRH
jgi:hypothetical protein